MMVALMSLGALSEQPRQEGTNEAEIRIGNFMPYTGALAVFGAIGKAEAAYFAMVNARGGINGTRYSL